MYSISSRAKGTHLQCIQGGTKRNPPNMLVYVKTSSDEGGFVVRDNCIVRATSQLFWAMYCGPQELFDLFDKKGFSYVIYDPLCPRHACGN